MRHVGFCYGGTLALSRVDTVRCSLLVAVSDSFGAVAVHHLDFCVSFGLHPELGRPAVGLPALKCDGACASNVLFSSAYDGPGRPVPACPVVFDLALVIFWHGGVLALNILFGKTGASCDWLRLRDCPQNFRAGSDFP